MFGHRWNTLKNDFSALFQEVNSVYQILSAILNTGNIEFTAITSQHQTDKSEVPNSEALENGEKEPKAKPSFCFLITMDLQLNIVNVLLC